MENEFNKEHLGTSRDGYVVTLNNYIEELSKTNRPEDQKALKIVKTLKFCYEKRCEANRILDRQRCDRCSHNKNKERKYDTGIIR